MAKTPHKILAFIGLTLIAFSALGQNNYNHANERDPDGTWRFHMVQNGRVMTADDFSAWMAQRGLGVQDGRSIHTAGNSSFPTQRQTSYIQAPTQPSFAQQANWDPAVEPIRISEFRQDRPSVDENGSLTGYDSGWEAAGLSGGYTTSGHSSGRTAERTNLVSYDSGRDY